MLYLIPALSNNYMALFAWDHQALVIDPSSAKEIITLLKEKELELFAILNTHHHPDHVEGNEALKEKYDCSVIGPPNEEIPGLTQTIADGEELDIGPFRIDVIATPGHTKTAVVYYFPDIKILFTGDTLFLSGCGRLFEGTAKEMWDSLQKILKLPPDTQIFCGHEYTLKDLQFALSLEPDNKEIRKRLEEAKQKLELSKTTLPSTLKEECKTNPFFRVNDPAIKKAISLPNGSPLEVFIKLRQIRDHF